MRVRATTINHHDIWSLKGVGLPAEKLPMILGCDGAGTTDDGQEVIVHAVISRPQWKGDETEDPKRSLLSEVHPGTMAEEVWVPDTNLVAKPAELSFEEAACLPTAWLTAYRMLFTRARLQPGETVLVQGVSGGVASASIALGRAAGLKVFATTRDLSKAARAMELGAVEVFESGARLPIRVDSVIDSVGASTWAHSLKSLRPGGRLVTCGATSGPNPGADLNRIFFLQLQVIGSTMGTREELVRLIEMVTQTGIRPVIDRVTPFDGAPDAFSAVLSGSTFGKVVLHP